MSEQCPWCWDHDCCCGDDENCAEVWMDVPDDFPGYVLLDGSAAVAGHPAGQEAT